MPKLAPQTRVAFSSIFWNTGFSSPGDELMTSSTSEVAVCCSQRLAQIIRATTQFLEQARILDGDDGLLCEVGQTDSICLSLKRRTSCRKIAITPTSSFSRSIGTMAIVRAPARSEIATMAGLPLEIGRQCPDIFDVNHFMGSGNGAEWRSAGAAGSTCRSYAWA